MKYLVVLDVEPKDSPVTDAEFPRIQDLVARLNNVLQDVTAHDEQIGWLVSKVERINRIDLIT